MLIALLLLTGPAHAWTFTPGAICTLEHQTTDVAVTLTYDPSGPLYTIAFERTAAFPVAPTFSILFDGPAALQIGTNRHVLSGSDTRLSVADSGFGNVLNGLQFNIEMRALIGNETLRIPLVGAAEPVAAFRACEDAVPTA
ncbi:hypothetical protein [Sulfitobacter aestuariivivens]|nr:hypothetical protein [Sulfitobacter aestuariivivens]